MISVWTEPCPWLGKQNTQTADCTTSHPVCCKCKGAVNEKGTRDATSFSLWMQKGMDKNLWVWKGITLGRYAFCYRVILVLSGGTGSRSDSQTEHGGPQPALQLPTAEQLFTKETSYLPTPRVQMKGCREPWALQYDPKKGYWVW